MAATIRDLPSAELDGLWGSLVYPDDVKPRLLSYIYTTLLLSDANVDFNIVTWNRCVRLEQSRGYANLIPPAVRQSGPAARSSRHGKDESVPCPRAEALHPAVQQVGGPAFIASRRLPTFSPYRYTHGKLIEINSHSLFSKWFSESGKLVQKLFQRVTEAVEEDGGFVVVLIGESGEQRAMGRVQTDAVWSGRRGGKPDSCAGGCDGGDRAVGCAAGESCCGNC